VRDKRGRWTAQGIEGPRTKQVRHAIPVYAVDTLEEAGFIQCTLCVHRWDGSFALTKDWEAPNTLELTDLEGVTEMIHEIHERYQSIRRAPD